MATSVFIVFTASSDYDTMSDPNFTAHARQNWSPKVVGVFQSKKIAQETALECIEDEGGDVDGDNVYGRDGLVAWEGFEQCDDANDGVPTVWVEEHAIGDVEQPRKKRQKKSR
eukprot:TRINITY_DN8819_c0_g1_i1.p1 TRINITY_DN8819_c0_g1~~TRINITY_DN8819_c0_g1_i1.p1  ORF type:complete len:123 (-),score=16.95 TRINITY_DN8819_c0_g1_i1:137-475(-)